jgi:molybdate transport repressor ModE-like protein
MDWDDLKVFLAIARAGRISAAARQLGVEHSTIGRRLAALEDDLGARLFHRTAGGYRLTPHGERVLASAQTMERAALTVQARVASGTDDVSGVVRIAVLDEYASYWIAPRLPAFRALHPALALEIVVGMEKLDLSRGEAELAVRTPRPREAGLVTARLGKQSSGLYASREFLAPHKKLRIQDVESARGVPFLVYSARYHALQSAPWFQPVLESADIVLRTNSTHALVAAAQASSGVAVLPRLIGNAHPDLVAVSADLSSAEFWLVTHPEFRHDPRVRAVVAFLREQPLTDSWRPRAAVPRARSERDPKSRRSGTFSER